MKMGKRLLIVEDDEDIQNYYTFLLAGLELEIIRAFSGEEALETLAGGAEIDLILLDVVLPGMGGDEFYRVLRQERESKIPVVVCSVDERMSQRVQDVGEVQGVFTKGTQGADLRSIIEGVLEKHASSREDRQGPR
jgi:CheY-like chemotaxis protein